MKINNFSGGIELNNYKNAEKCRVERFIPKEKLRFTSDFCGERFLPTVSAGETVQRCQLIAVSADDGSRPLIYSPVSGTVTEVTEAEDGKTIVIENDGQNALWEGVKPHDKKLSETTPDEIISVIASAAVYDPTRKRYVADIVQDAQGHVRFLAVNCTESEPYSSSVRRLALEKAQEVVNGAKILMKALGVITARIASPDNDSEAVNAMIAATKSSSYIKVSVVKGAYPQGSDTVLSYSLTGEELEPGADCVEAGICIVGAEACAAVYRAFAMGTPHTERYITVDGNCVKDPRNLCVPYGTSYAELAEYCGVSADDPCVYDTGIASAAVSEFSISAVTPATRALSFISGKKAGRGGECIRCGRCVGVCPQRILPLKLAGLCLDKKLKAAKSAGLYCCIECGTCEFVCPASIPLLQIIRDAKSASDGEGGKTE